MDPMLFLPLLLLAVMLVLMWRGSQQRAKLQGELKAKTVVGAEVMTQAGIYGTIVGIDEAANVTTIETTPGTRIRVHSMTIANVVEPTVPDDASELVVDPAGDAGGTSSAGAQVASEATNGPQAPAGGAPSAEARSGDRVGDDLDDRDGEAPRA